MKKINLLATIKGDLGGIEIELADNERFYGFLNGHGINIRYELGRRIIVNAITTIPVMIINDDYELQPLL